MSEKPALFQRISRSLFYNPDYRNISLENSDIKLTGGNIANVFGLGKTSAGKDVDEVTALTFSAVWACVRAYAGPFSYFPVQIFKKTKDGREKIDHPLKKFFDRPQPYMNGNKFKETAVMHYILWGNAYIEPVRKGMSRAGSIIGFFIHHPSKVKVIQSGSDVNQKIIYEIQYKDKEKRILSADQILHFANLGDSVVGIGPITQAREDIGLEMARRGYGSEYFAEGAKPSGILKVKSRLSEKQMDELRVKHQVAKQGGNDLILDFDSDYQPLTIPPEDSQFLETGHFSVNTVARWFGVPPPKIQDLQNGVQYRNLEELNIAFLKDAIAPMVEKFEVEFNTKLEKDLGDGVYIQFDMESYLRADATAMAEQNRTGIQNAYKTPNQIRERNGDNPIDGGDRLFIQSNMVPLDLIDSIYNSEQGQQMIAQMLADKIYNREK